MVEYGAHERYVWQVWQRTLKAGKDGYSTFLPNIASKGHNALPLLLPDAADVLLDLKAKAAEIAQIAIEEFQVSALYPHFRLMRLT